MKNALESVQVCTIFPPWLFADYAQVSISRHSFDPPPHGPTISHFYQMSLSHAIVAVLSIKWQHKCCMILQTSKYEAQSFKTSKDWMWTYKLSMDWVYSFKPFKPSKEKTLLLQTFEGVILILQTFAGPIALLQNFEGFNDAHSIPHPNYCKSRFSLEHKYYNSITKFRKIRKVITSTPWPSSVFIGRESTLIR